MWFGRRQGAARVVGCQCRRTEFAQFLLVGPVNPFLILSKCSVWLQDTGWARVSGNWCLVSLIRGGGRVVYVELLWRLNFLSVCVLFTTSVLFVFGMTLLLANVSEGRFAEIKKQLQVCKAKRALRPS